MNTVEGLLRAAHPEVASILDACMSGAELSFEDALRLDTVEGADLAALCGVADAMRKAQAGDVVTYVVNRNINFTNLCVKSCKFCAFSRDLRSEQGYLLSPAEIVRRALEARDYGASEVCLQAGLLPDGRGALYAELCRAIKARAPDLHIHAFSPEEIKYGSKLARVSIREFLAELKAAGLGSLPGTSAEILDDEVRADIAPGRITTAQWREVISTAHELGIPTTATMMFGHVETSRHRIGHLTLLRSMQKQTGGFTEFVPLSFVHAEAPLFLQAEGRAVSAGPSESEKLRLYALARLILGPSFKNIQASWVKEGLDFSQRLLDCGVNDLGGTLMNESISTAAGAQHGQCVSPKMLRTLIRKAGRIPVERTTLYKHRKQFDATLDAVDAVEPLDNVTEPAKVFGTYDELLRDPRFHHEWDASAAKRSLKLFA